MKRVSILFIIQVLLILTACNNNHLLERMNTIKEVGNSQPEKALTMLDSIKPEVSDMDEYTKMKCELLNLRLNDKAYHIPSSDIMAKKVVMYFDDHGTDLDRQEAYYYCGSVYRDLQDTPRAIKNFLKSIEIGEYCSDRDSLLLKNAYSNMQYLLFNVQDYKNALLYARKEYKISEELHSDVLLPTLHVASSCSYLNKKKEAKFYFDKAYNYVLQHRQNVDVDNLYTLLYNLSYLKEFDKAKVCLNIINSIEKDDTNASHIILKAEYYEKIQRLESAEIYYKMALSKEPTLVNIYDASKFLFRTNEKRGNSNDALKYADLYIKANDSLNLGKRQELAATVNNQYQYHLDEKKQEEVQEKAEDYRYLAIIITISAVLILSVIVIIYNVRSNKNLRKMISQSNKLKEQKENIDKLQKEINQQTSKLNASNSELEGIRQKLEDVSSKLKEANDDLAQKEELLTQKMEQGKVFLRLLHKSELESNAEDVINNVKQTAKGKKQMTPAEWKQLYKAIDELYPDFKDRLTEKLGNFTEEQMQVCYLLRIGLTNPLIQHLTNIPRATIWRWSKKFEWAAPNGQNFLENDN